MVESKEDLVVGSMTPRRDLAAAEVELCRGSAGSRIGGLQSWRRCYRIPDRIEYEGSARGRRGCLWSRRGWIEGFGRSRRRLRVGGARMLKGPGMGGTKPGGDGLLGTFSVHRG